MMKKLWLIALLLAGCGSVPLWAQVTLQVVSKNIEKTMPWKPGMELVVNGEKLDVTVVPTDSAMVSVTAELSAKHPDLDTAQADVDAWQWAFSTVGKKMYLRAYIGVKAGKRMPVSNMRGHVLIKLPKQCPIELSNKFGRAKIEQLDAPVALSGYFCRFDLSALSGDLKIESEHGPVEAIDLKGQVEIKGKRADLTLRNLAGDCAIEAEYGTVNLSAGSSSGSVRITGQMTHIILDKADTTTHHFQLQTRYGKIDVPDQFDKNTTGDQEVQASHLAKSGSPTIEAKTQFAHIKVEK